MNTKEIDERFLKGNLKTAGVELIWRLQKEVKLIDYAKK